MKKLTSKKKSKNRPRISKLIIFIIQIYVLVINLSICFTNIYRNSFLNRLSYCKGGGLLDSTTSISITRISQVGPLNVIKRSLQ